MDITFLIGNGFDLGLGLYTSFTSFLEKYKKWPEDSLDDQNLKEDRRNLITEINGHTLEWSDFEKKLGEYTINFSPTTIKRFYNLKVDFQKKFINYLISEEKRVVLKPEIIKTTFQKALVDFYKPKTHILAEEECSIIGDLFRKYNNQGCTFNFIDYNYTLTLDNCIKIIPDKSTFLGVHSSTGIYNKIGDIIHVHGTREEHLILGVDNKSQIANPSLRESPEFTDIFIKPDLNKQLHMGYDTKARDLINKSQIICIYGMSIGETDATWWKILSNWLINSHYRYLIIYSHDDNFDDLFAEAVVIKKREITQKFLEFSNLKDSQKKEILNRIYIVINKDVFQMDLAKKV